MTLNRINLTIAAVFAVLFVAALVAAASGGSATPTPNHGRLQVDSLAPWQQTRTTDKPVYAKVVWHPHQMCDELRHQPTMQQSPKL